MKIPLSDAKEIIFPKIKNRAGNITVVQNKENFPFEVKRIFYLYDIPGGESRGGHAHKQCHQMLVAASGSFEVIIHDGHDTKKILLNRPDKGLHIPPGLWASEVNFSSGAICLVLTSHEFDEQDYIREFDEYLIENK